MRGYFALEMEGTSGVIFNNGHFCLSIVLYFEKLKQ